MTIEEIKEWRKEGGSPHYKANEIIDTLLAEVATLEKHNAYADQYNAVQDLHLTIATEAFERIATNPLVHSSNHQSEMRPDEIASTALNKIKGEEK